MGQTTVVETPASRMVFQRASDNTAIVPVRGRVPNTATRVIARLVARQGGQTTDWREATLSNGTFRINIPATGGFYDLELVTLANTTELERQRRERIGVGEVFVISGQSNNFGEAGKGLPATDDRVSVVNYWPGSEGNVDENALPMAFAQAGPGTYCGPRNPLYIWGGLGDRLVARLGVPVLFLGAAHPGSSTNNWREAAQGVQNVSGRDWTNNLPYRPLRLALQVYGRQTGVRSILWHQGESDNAYQTTEGYMNNMKVVVSQTRNDLGFGNLCWVIARASFFPFYVGRETDPNIVTAQNLLISGDSNCFPGPYTDPYTGPNYRAELLHFSENAYSFLADLWNNSLTGDYFQRSRPSLPDFGPASPVASAQQAPPVAETTPVTPPKVGGPLTLIAPTYNCQSGALGLRSSGGNGSPVEFSIPGVMGWTTNTNQIVGEGLRRDAQTLTIYARQAGQQVSLVWNIRTACDGSAPVAPAPTDPPVVNTPSTPVPNSPAPGGAFVMLVPAYNCQTGAVTFATIGGNGSPVEYMAPGITGWTTNPSHVVGEGVRRDAQSITIFARQAGQQVSMVWNIRAACDGSATNQPPTVNSTVQPTSPTPAPGGPLVVLVPTYSCQTGAVAFATLGGNGSPVEYMAPGITGWTTNPSHVIGEGIRRDAQTITIYARQSGQQASLVWNIRAFCTGGSSSGTTARIAQTASSPEVQWVVSPNPTIDEVQLIWPDVVRSTWTSRVITAAGQDLPVDAPVQNPMGLKLNLRRVPTGVYFWQVAPAGQPAQTFRIMKVD